MSNAPQRRTCETSRPSRDLRFASWLLVAIVVLGTAYHIHSGGGWNVMTRLALIRAIVHDRTLSINRSHHRTGDKAEFPPGSGNYYCDKPVGAQVLGLVGYVVGLHAANRPALQRRVVLTAAAATATWFASGLPTVALALVMLHLLVAMGHTIRRAVFVVLATIFGTLLWPYATFLYGHQAAACFGFIGFAFAFWAMRSRLPILSAVLAGFFCAWSAVSEFPASLILLSVGAYLALAQRRLGLLFAASALPPIALQLAYNYACFGSVLRFGYMFEANPDFRNPAGWVSYPRAGVLLALLLSPDKGILFLSPHLGFAAWGLYRAIRWGQWRREAVVCAIVAGGFLLYNAGHYLWRGGTCFGPRHLVSMLPFLGIGLAWAWPAMGAGARRICLALLAWAILVQFAAVSIGVDAPPILLTGSYGPAEVLVRLWMGSLEWPNFGLWLGLGAHGSLLFHAGLLAALVAGLAAGLRRCVRPPSPQSGPSPCGQR